MNPLTDQAIFILGCVGVIAFATIVLILLGATVGLGAEIMTPKRARLLRACRAGLMALIVAAILAIAWRAKNG